MKIVSNQKTKDFSKRRRVRAIDSKGIETIKLGREKKKFLTPK